jgi:hypothetical protein
VRIAALVLLAVVVALVVAEVGVRLANPQPRVQVVRGYGLHLEDGVPVWTQARDRENRACVDQHPERLRVLFFGSSITFGTGLSAAETFTTQLQERLNRLRPSPGFCVLSFAQPGFAFEQKLAVARREVARYRPALVMWESWAEWFDFTLLGDAAYCTKGYRLRPDGNIGVDGVPDTLNRLLLRRSRLYQHLAFAAAARDHSMTEVERARHFAATRLVKVPELARSVGAKLAIYLAPPLDRDFPAQVAAPPDWHPELAAVARSRGVPTYLLQQELVAQDFRAVRLDPCCHYNAAGHRALAAVMERLVLAQLDAPR